MRSSLSFLKSGIIRILILSLITFASFAHADDYLVGAIYQPGWQQDSTLVNSSMANHYCSRMPLTGWYEETPGAMEKFKDWATAYGVDYFLFNYFHVGHKLYSRARSLYPGVNRYPLAIR